MWSQNRYHSFKETELKHPIRVSDENCQAASITNTTIYQHIYQQIQNLMWKASKEPMGRFKWSTLKHKLFVTVWLTPDRSSPQCALCTGRHPRVQHTQNWWILRHHTDSLPGKEQKPNIPSEKMIKVIRKHTSLPLIKHYYQLISSFRSPLGSPQTLWNTLAPMDKLQLLLAFHVCCCFLFFCL